MLFAAFSLLLHLFRMGYFIIMRDCKAPAQVLSPFIEAPFLGLQVIHHVTSTVSRLPIYWPIS